MGRSILVTIALLLLTSTAHGDEQVTIYASLPQGPMPMSAMGFINGIDEDGALDHSMVSTLNPVHWRTGKLIAYDFASEHDASRSFELSFNYAWSQGGYPNARPWEDWQGWEQYVVAILDYLHAYYPDALPAFYDVWNEPDHSYFWTGTYGQLLELFARTITVVRDYDPNLRLVGPSISRFIPGSEGVAGILGFLEDLDQIYGVRLDAVAWHENDSGNYGGYMPEDIPGHAAQIRDGIIALFGPDYQPELQINEYAGSRVHLSPGWNVAYIQYLVDSGVDAAMRACWNVYSSPPYQGWSDCWDGLDGMFMRDGLTPTHAYWVYRQYAEMATSERLTANSTSERTTLMAGRDDEAEMIEILIGRHWQGGAGTVDLRILGYPYDHGVVLVETWRIPHDAGFFTDPPRILPLPDGPLKVSADVHPVVYGIVEHAITGFASNDAYVVRIKADLASGVGDDASAAPIELQFEATAPNPFHDQTKLSFTLLRPGTIRLSIFDPAGRLVDTLLKCQLPAGEYVQLWDGRDAAGRPAAPGLYLARLAAGPEIAEAKLLLVR